MTPLTMIDSPAEKPRLAAGTPAVLTAAAPRLWRVERRSGRIIGHMATRADLGGTRYIAQRLHLATGRFRVLGEFWSPDDAVECLLHPS